jgi:acetolactate synthase-1/2/3 large subunit
MGFGFPAALGAQVANPDRMVISITGDGSFQMSMQELATIVEFKLPVKVMILNNGFLGMVRQWQQLFFGRRYSGTDISVQPDFVKLAQSYGVDTFRLEEEKDVEEGLRKMLSCKGACVMDVRISPEENVYPMVPTGAPLSHMLLV